MSDRKDPGRYPDAPEPDEADVEAWAERERRRRAAWLAGPTEEEKAAWARRQVRRRSAAASQMFDDLDAEDPDLGRTARQMRRLAMLGQRGMLFWGLNWPFWLMERVLLSGLEWEDEVLRPRRRRVILDEEDD